MQSAITHRSYVPLLLTVLLLTPAGRTSAQTFPLEEMTFLAGDGTDPFGLTAVTVCGEPDVPLAGDIYFGALDLTPDHTELYGVSWDELYRIDVDTGAAERLGHIVWAPGYREWFSGPVVTGRSVLPGGWVYVYYLRATVSFEDYYELTYETTIEAIDALLLPLTETVIVDELIEYEPPGEDLRSVRLVVTLDSDGAATIELLELAGPDLAFVHGVFTATTPGMGATEGDRLRIPVTGITISPTGQMLVLSEAEWDPEGRASLYELEIGEDEVLAIWLSELDNENIWAIEFADNGTLYGVGNWLYTINRYTGATQFVSKPGPPLIADLDWAPDSRLYGVEADTNGPVALYDLTPGEEQTVAVWVNEPVWGLAVLDRGFADLDGDGDVDANDQLIYDAEYTGPLTSPHVPPGTGGPPPLDPIVVPFDAELGTHCPPDSYVSVDGCVDDAARVSLDALDAQFPGIVVDGTTAGLPDSSATIYLAHDNDWLHVGIEIEDDVVLADPGYDVVEFYLDSNNSDLPVTEGNAFGFQATWDAAGNQGGDPGAMSAWTGRGWFNFLPGYRAWFSIDKGLTGMEAGGTYGFDLAIYDADDLTPTDFAYYFLFSADTNGWRDESRWGNIRLAKGPLPDRATDPDPASWDVLVDANTNLTWTPAPNAVSHRVYLGGNPDALVYQRTQVSTTFNPGPLSQGWTYYWRIDEVSTNGTRTGQTWAFTTRHSVADLDRDGDVDERDLGPVAQLPGGDLTGDALVNSDDLIAFLDALGATIGDPAYDAGADYDNDGEITLADYDIWLCHYAAFWDGHFCDLDLDGDVDLDDFALLADCLTGPVEQATIECYDADLTRDDRVDLLDAATFYEVYAGSRSPDATGGVSASAVGWAPPTNPRRSQP